jgi:hypothetical protein
MYRRPLNASVLYHCGLGFSHRSSKAVLFPILGRKPRDTPPLVRARRLGILWNGEDCCNDRYQNHHPRRLGLQPSAAGRYLIDLVYNLIDVNLID